MQKIKKIAKMLLLFVLVISNNITKVEAAANDTTMISRVFEDVFAIQKYSTGGSRIYEALVYNMMKNGKIDIGYCIQIGQKIGTTNYSSTNDYTKFGIDKKTSDYIRLVAYYGYNYPNHADYKYFLAAQELIWEKLVDDEIYWTIGASVDGTKVDVESQKKEIETLVNNHYLKPEFTNKTINYKEKITLEDKNKILSEYKITSITNATYTISGNNLIITPTSLDDVTITLKRNLKKTYSNNEMFYYATNSQNIVSTGIIDDNEHQIKLKNNGVKLKINKKDATTHENINSSDVAFKIYDINHNKFICDNEVCEFNTNEDGVAIIPFLKKGNYKLEELDKLMDGYLYNPETIEFSVDDQSVIFDEKYGNVIELDFYNQKPTAKLTINKTGQKMVADNNLINYESIKLKDIEFNIITNQDIFYNDKEYVSGEVIATVKTNDEGIAIVDGLPLGEYLIKEINNNDMYELNNKEYIVNFIYKDQYTKVIDKTISIENFLKKGNLRFRKIDSYTKEGLKDVLIAIYDEFNNLIYEGKTDDNGNIYLDNLTYGKYYIKEVKQLEGYLINENQINFEINNDNPIAKVIMENEKIELPPKTLNKKISYFPIIIFSTLIYLLCHKSKDMI